MKARSCNAELLLSLFCAAGCGSGPKYSLVLIDDFDDPTSAQAVATDNKPLYVPAGTLGLTGFFENDKGGLTITPDRDDDIVPVAGGATGKGIHFKGTDSVCTWGAVIALTFLTFEKDFVNDATVAGKFRAPFNAAAFAGISFWAKTGGGLAEYRVKTPIPGTVPTDSGGTCAEHCWDDFGKNLTFTTEWKRYNVLFKDMTQANNFPAVGGLTTDKLFSIDFGCGACTALAAANPHGFDLWVDNLALLKEDPNGDVLQ